MLKWNYKKGKGIFITWLFCRRLLSMTKNWTTQTQALNRVSLETGSVTSHLSFKLTFRVYKSRKVALNNFVYEVRKNGP